jgi:uracil-DNA glycosylase family 4
MVIGQEPGTTECATGRAFSGPAGARLDKWLIAAGAPAGNPRQDVYLTSRLKCRSSDAKIRGRMALNCDGFLTRQIELVKPRLVISLGALSYEFFADPRIPYEQGLCRLVRSSDYLIFPFGHPFDHLAWPHPSGLNRWLNSPGNVDRLSESFGIARLYIPPRYPNEP